MTRLMFGDTTRSADMFAVLPLAIIDPFLLIVDDDRTVAMIGVIERDRVVGLDLGIEVLDPVSLGRMELLRSGISAEDADPELCLRACREVGVTEAVVPPDFPLAVADHLRAGGVRLTVDSAEFRTRRRSKTPNQLAGVRRAQAAADVAMAEAARMLRECPEGLTAEQVRSAMQAVCDQRGSTLADDVIVAVGAQSASGHESGSGPIVRGDLVLIDIWPHDKASRCFADMTRTFVAGGAEPPEELLEYWRLCRAALDAVMAEVRPGVTGRRHYDAACDVFVAAGQPTLRATEDGRALEEGFFHSLGHGVGIEVHEAPGLGLAGEPLVAGDVLAIEPGCYRQGFGGVRLEDIVLVTGDGGEILTDFPYDLAP